MKACAAVLSRYFGCTGISLFCHFDPRVNMPPTWALGRDMLVGVGQEKRKKVMKKAQTNWMSNPTKKQLILFTLIWFIGIFLITISIADLFRESFFKNSNPITYVLIIMSTITIAKLYRNFQWLNN